MRDLALILGRIEANGSGRDLPVLVEFGATTDRPDAATKPASAPQQTAEAAHKTARIAAK
jgi:hypothetical protein